ncbi:MAG: class I SAM-dependent methyltransferase [Candidatus Diapherotrites archaeon]|nr:class I SAM-dependent methyltransferase [Candidatus Diapherotrites archaeon]
MKKAPTIGKLFSSIDLRVHGVFESLSNEIVKPSVLAVLGLKRHERWQLKPEKYLADDYLSEIPSNSVTRTALYAAINRTAGRKVLDIGCGPGIFFDGFRKNCKTKTYIGIDITPKMVKIAKKRFPEADFRKGDITKLDFKDAEYSICIISHVLEHLAPETCKKAIRESVRVAKRKVIIEFFIPPREKETTRQLDYFYYNQYDGKELKKFIRSLNCKIKITKIIDKEQPIIKNRHYEIWEIEKKIVSK